MMELQLGNTYVRENIYRLLVLMYSKSQLYVVRSLSRGLTLSDASNFMTRASRLLKKLVSSNFLTTSTCE